MVRRAATSAGASPAGASITAPTVRQVWFQVLCECIHTTRHSVPSSCPKLGVDPKLHVHAKAALKADSHEKCSVRMGRVRQHSSALDDRDSRICPLHRKRCSDLPGSTSTPERNVTTTFSSLLKLAQQVHLADTECSGPLVSGGLTSERTDSMGWGMLCEKCNAHFGRVSIQGPAGVGTALGVLMAGSTFGHWSASHEFGDSLSFSGSSFLRHQKVVLPAIGRVWDEEVRRVKRQVGCCFLHIKISSVLTRTTSVVTS